METFCKFKLSWLTRYCRMVAIVLANLYFMDCLWENPLFCLLVRKRTYVWFLLKLLASTKWVKLISFFLVTKPDISLLSNQANNCTVTVNSNFAILKNLNLSLIRITKVLWKNEKKKQKQKQTTTGTGFCSFVEKPIF